MPSILLFGVTGLVGSHLVLGLHETYPDYPVTVYLRNNKIDDYLKSSARVKEIVHGTYGELGKIQVLASKHDIIINVGSSWDVSLSEAIVAGLKQRTGTKILIHMSGTGNFVETRWKDGAHHSESKIWSDENVEDMKLINPEMLNGGPDTVVLNAGKNDGIDTYIVIPSAIYGASAGPISALGVVQSLMYEKAKELGFVPYIGEGTAISNGLHTKDVSRFVLTLIPKALQGKAEGSVYERLYILNGADGPWHVVSNAFAKFFYARGFINTPEAKSVSLDQAGGGEIPMLMAMDMRVVGPRAGKVGHRNEELSLLDFLESEEAASLRF
ncbi:hypothetical protein AA313_de0209932 [Arthrobotrys entomopaga]|nr:hypothetical protein AA313_de0209932 [Arthrobotrys entomopaga]